MSKVYETSKTMNSKDRANKSASTTQMVQFKLMLLFPKLEQLIGQILAVQH
jgi:hypothetical protein